MEDFLGAWTPSIYYDMDGVGIGIYRERGLDNMGGMGDLGG